MEIAQYCQTIGNEISGLVKEPFKKITLDSRVTDDTADMGIQYISDGGEIKFVIMPSDSASLVANSLIFLRKVMKKNDQQCWANSTFTLTPDGKFNLEVSYDE